MASMEKGITQSKKFIGAMTFNVLWLISIWIAIKSDQDKAMVVNMIHYAGITQIIYLGGQAALDTIVRRAITLGLNGMKKSPKNDM